MKEIIVIERDIEYLKELEREREEMFMTFPEYRTEQVPETFEELRELCKELKKKTSTPMDIGRTHIAISTLSKDLFFQKDGSIEYGWDILFKNSASNKKDWGYMYFVIKSLIGEE